MSAERTNASKAACVGKTVEQMRTELVRAGAHPGAVRRDVLCNLYAQVIEQNVPVLEAWTNEAKRQLKDENAKIDDILRPRQLKLLFHDQERRALKNTKHLDPTKHRAILAYKKEEEDAKKKGIVIRGRDTSNPTVYFKPSTHARALSKRRKQRERERLLKSLILYKKLVQVAGSGSFTVRRRTKR
jgi:hypothetical protein